MAAPSTPLPGTEIAEGIKEANIIDITESLAPPGYIIHSLGPESPSSLLPSGRITYAAHLPQPLIDRYLFRRLPAHLRLPATDLHILISTRSGTEKAETYFETLLKPVLQAVGLDDRNYNVVRTESHETVTQFANGILRERAWNGIAQTVLLLSGDGGVVDVINGLSGTEHVGSRAFIRPTIVLFPLGTGNALFHSLHRPASSSTSPPSDATLALRTLLFGSPKPLPMFRAAFSPSSRLLSNEGRTASPIPSSTLYGSIVASYGLHATLVADSDTPECRTHGSARFRLVAQTLLKPPDGSPPHAYRARVTLRKDTGDQALDRQEHGYILLTYLSNLEKTFAISPASTPLDRKLRVVHFGPEPAEEVARIMGAVHQGGKHIESGRVGYEEVDGLRIAFLEKDEDREAEDRMEGRWRRVCIDGLIVRVEEGGWMEVTKVAEGEEAIDVVAPHIPEAEI